MFDTIGMLNDGTEWKVGSAGTYMRYKFNILLDWLIEIVDLSSFFETFGVLEKV